MRRLVAALLFLAACPASAPDVVQGPTPPVTPEPGIAPHTVHLAAPLAARKPTTRTLHGDAFTDDWFWLRDKGTPEVEAYLRAEKDYADQVLAPLAGLQERLFDELVSHLAEDDDSVPAADGGWLYWVRRTKGKDHPIHLRKRTAPGAAEEVVLDVNALAEGQSYMAVDAFDVDDRGELLLFSTDDKGFREHTLQVKDLTSGALLPDRIEHVVMATWTSAPRTLVYVVEDEAKRPYRAYLHRLGDDPKEDKLLYEERDGRFELYAWRTPSRAYVVLHAQSKLESEARLLDAKHPERAPVLVEARRADHEYWVDHLGKDLLVRTNDEGKNFRIARAPVKTPGSKHWKTLVAHDEAKMIEAHQVVGDALVLEVRAGGLPELDVVDPARGGTRRIALPDPVHEVGLDPAGNREPRAREVRYVYESLATPRSTFAYDLASGASRLLREDPVPGGFDRTRYVTERISATAVDGTAIPVSIVRRKDVALDGRAPLHLVGYGAYGFSMPLRFVATRLPLLDRGVVIALAHIRGGGELGKRWHEGGRMATKMNTFTDFIAVAEHLVNARYTTPARLSIEGASAGGLLMGAVLNLRPDLFKAALVKVPFVDVLNTMNDPTLPLTITEYEEWGNPNVAEQYAWMRAYSPYENVKAQDYPAMLVKTSYHDSQVMYWEPAKWVARLRSLKTDPRPLLFRIHLDGGGHGGKSGRYEQLRDLAVDQSFLLWQLGVEPMSP